MTFQSAEEVIKQELSTARSFDTNETWAKRVLSALQSGGYAVVKLPGQCIVPTGWGEDCLGAWPTTADDDPVSAWPKRQVATPDDKWLNPADARSLAAALLAAAEAAERAS